MIDIWSTTWPDWYTDERVVILLADHTTILLPGRRPPINLHVCVLHLKIIHTISSLCNYPLQQGAFSLYHGDYKSRSYYGSIKAASTSRENEKRRKSAARKCEWSKSQSEDQRSEIRQTDLMGHAEGCACLSEEGRSKIRQTNRTGHADAHVCQRSSEEKYGRPIGRGMQRGAHICRWSNMQRMVHIISIYYCCYHLSCWLPQRQRRWQPHWQKV